MERWINDIHQGDAMETLAEMPANSVHCVMTSPPYFGLRDYGEGIESVFGGDEDCNHRWETRELPSQGGTNTDSNPPNTGADSATQDTRLRGEGGVESDYCPKCGAWKGQLGLEPDLDQYIQNLVEVGQEIRRVLRPDGNWWLNLGDSFAGSGRGQWDNDEGQPKESYRPDAGELPEQNSSLRRKSKMLVPHRVAIALEEAGWIVRSDAVWKKPNPMPHPVKDRFNEHKEFLFHLTPEPDYYFDLDAIREPHKQNSIERRRRDDGRRGGLDSYGQREHTGFEDDDLHPDGKNPGDIIEVSVKSFPEAHFAVYPPELCERPIKASCPEKVCAGCGAPYSREDDGWRTTCSCETDETEPGIVLDPFAGAGTTALVAKDYDRQFVGIELNPEYVAMAQSRVGVTVDEPERLLEDGETSLAAFTQSD